MELWLLCPLQSQCFSKQYHHSLLQVFLHLRHHLKQLQPPSISSTAEAAILTDAKRHLRSSSPPNRSEAGTRDPTPPPKVQLVTTTVGSSTATVQLTAKIPDIEKCLILLPLCKLRRPPVRTLHFISEVQGSSKLYYALKWEMQER